MIVPHKKNVISDSRLTEQEFVNKYLESMGGTPEVENYLRVRYQWMNLRCPWEQVYAAYEKTNLKNTIQNH